MNQEADEPESWWDSGRRWKAIAIAPLAAPLIVSVKFGSSGAPDSVIAYIAPIVLALAYSGTIVFGLPLYLLLRAFRLTAFWLAPVAGIVVGFAVMFLFLLGIGTKGLEAVTEAIQHGGPPGAAVGALFWLIARPDRPDPSDDELVLPKFNWNTTRVLVAFLAAPVALPVIVALVYMPFIPGMRFEPFFAYPIALLMSVPLFRILRELRLTGFWTAAVAGCAIGLATSLVLSIMGIELSSALAEQPRSLILLVFTLSGSVLGAIFWLIARPDRQT